jgi:hypothetical protein
LNSRDEYTKEEIEDHKSDNRTTQERLLPKG